MTEHIVNIDEEPEVVELTDIRVIRQTVKNNPVDCSLNVVVVKHFLPHVLVDLGFFPSTSEVKRNRPDLWKEIDGSVTIGRITLNFWEEI